MAKIRVAMMGSGNIQGKHVGTFQRRDDVEIVGLCDVSAASMQRLAEQFGLDGDGGPPRFADGARMYDETKPDAAVIATPHTLHFEHAMQALDAGCHVLMEKPMVTSAAHAYEVDEKVGQTGKVFVIGYNTPCTPEFDFLRRAIESETYGRLELVSGWVSQSWMKFVRGTWRVDPKLSGGGQAYDTGAHTLNSLCWTVRSRVSEVFAFADNLDTQVDVNSSINIRFENGVLAAVVVGGNCAHSGAHMCYMFDGGKIEICPWSGNWINIYDGDEKVKYPAITGAPMDPGDNFIDAILGRDAPRTSPRDGIIQSELMDAIYESVETGRPAKPKR